jgi:hypothetical protein
MVSGWPRRNGRREPVRFAAAKLIKAGAGRRLIAALARPAPRRMNERAGWSWSGRTARRW